MRTTDPRLTLTTEGVTDAQGTRVAHQPEVAAFPFLPAHDSHTFGGVYITTSQTPSAIYLVPAFEGEQARWMVAATGTAFTALTAQDLFLSAFGDDLAAMRRIRPLAGFDVFHTPWSQSANTRCGS